MRQSNLGSQADVHSNSKGRILSPSNGSQNELTSSGYGNNQMLHNSTGGGNNNNGI